MGKAVIRPGDLFNSEETYLCHQCNCVARKPAHLAKAVFDKFPYSDVYSNRKFDDRPGTINIAGNGKDQRYVINMFGQFYPGTPQFPNSKKDGYVKRLEYFTSCLELMTNLENATFAFPYKVGCGAAGGDWESYKDLLKKFSSYVKLVVVYKLEE